MHLIEKYIDEYLPIYCYHANLINDNIPSNSTVAANILRNYNYGTDEIEFFKEIKDNFSFKTMGKNVKDEFLNWLKWTTTDGCYYPEIRDYIKKCTPSVLTFLRKYKLYDNDSNEIDFLHLLSTFGAERHNLIDPNLAGWAGDLQSSIRDLRLAIDNDNYDDEHIDMFIC